MTIIKPGTRVRTKIGNIEAYVVAVYMEMETVEYRIRYFANGDEKTASVFRFEIETVSIKKQAGFNRSEEVEENNNEVTLIEMN